MRTYIISEATRDQFPALTLPGHAFKDTTRPRSDGTFELDLADDVSERVEAMRQAGESDDDVLFRLLAMTAFGIN